MILFLNIYIATIFILVIFIFCLAIITYHQESKYYEELKKYKEVLDRLEGEQNE